MGLIAGLTETSALKELENLSSNYYLMFTNKMHVYVCIFQQGKKKSAVRKHKQILFNAITMLINNFNLFDLP